MEGFQFPFGWRDILDIGIVTFSMYYVLSFVRGTRAIAALNGLLLLLVVYAVSSIAGLFTLTWLLEKLFSSLFLVIVILFNSDIRQALASISIKSLFKKKISGSEKIAHTLASTSIELAKNTVGALIVLEMSVPLGDIKRRGVQLDAKLSRELLFSIFNVKSPLHDGAVIISPEGRIISAGCVLPLAQMLERKHFGTRHRAALGLSEVSDAIIIIVSEERGEVTIAQAGHLSNPLTLERLERILNNALNT